jgi:hypothetical protein
MAVMPTCTVEITRTGSSISRSAARAPDEPASARGAGAGRSAYDRVLPDHEEGVARNQSEHGKDTEQLRHPSHAARTRLAAVEGEPRARRTLQAAVGRLATPSRGGEGLTAGKSGMLISAGKARGTRDPITLV